MTRRPSTDVRPFPVQYLCPRIAPGRHPSYWMIGLFTTTAALTTVALGWYVYALGREWQSPTMMLAVRVVGIVAYAILTFRYVWSAREHWRTTRHRYPARPGTVVGPGDLTLLGTGAVVAVPAGTYFPFTTARAGTGLAATWEPERGKTVHGFTPDPSASHTHGTIISSGTISSGTVSRTTLGSGTVGASMMLGSGHWQPVTNLTTTYAAVSVSALQISFGYDDDDDMRGEPVAQVGDVPLLGRKGAYLLRDQSTDGRYLFSALSQNVLYETRAEATCTCAPLVVTTHAAPDWNCTCGFYAWNEASAAAGQMAWGSAAYGLTVELGGKVIVCEHGYRAQWQKVLEVRVPDRCVACHMLPEVLVYAFGSADFYERAEHSGDYGNVQARCARCARSTAADDPHPLVIIDVAELEASLGCPVVFPTALTNVERRNRWREVRWQNLGS